MTIAQNKAICFSLLEFFIHFPFIYEKQKLPNPVLQLPSTLNQSLLYSMYVLYYF